jgi:hypothetical protein
MMRSRDVSCVCATFWLGAAARGAARRAAMRDARGPTAARYASAGAVSTASSAATVVGRIVNSQPLIVLEIENF